MIEQGRVAELERQLNWARSLMQTLLDDLADEQTRVAELERQLAEAQERQCARGRHRATTSTLFRHLLSTASTTPG